MYRLFTILFLLFGLLPAARSQTYFTLTEMGISFGGSQYFGDLNENYGLRTVNPSYGIYARRHLSHYISVKLCGNYTHVGYDDKYNSSEFKKQRNLNFQSDIYELTFQAEFNFFRFTTGDPYTRFSPYLTLGAGAFYYDPYTNYNGTKTYLRPIGTEGQFVGYSDRKYSSVSPCFPIGVGVKAWIKGGMNVTLEVANRLTTTDYLDDVSTTYVGANKFPWTATTELALQDRSVELNPAVPLGRAGKQRGNTSSYDQYLIAQVSLSWHFTTYRCPASLNGEFIRTY
jgi:hypothetical protein